MPDSVLGACASHLTVSKVLRGIYFLSKGSLSALEEEVGEVGFESSSPGPEVPLVLGEAASGILWEQSTSLGSSSWKRQAGKLSSLPLRHRGLSV